MKARDIMTTEVITVRADTPASDIARLLLENGISAVPVLDEAGAPIGMVSEGDLIGRDESEREARRDWWLAMLAEGETLSADFLATLREPTRVARDVMSSPVVTVSEDTDSAEIARLLQSYRIKRVPVVQNGRVVGIVSRENLLRTLVEPRPPHDFEPQLSLLSRAMARLEQSFNLLEEQKTALRKPQPQLLEYSPPTAADFRSLVLDHEMKEAQSHEDARRKAAEQRRQRLQELIDQHISDKAWRDLIHQARSAAEHGTKEFMLLRFPSELCADGGRAINVGEPGWPATLRGEPAEIYLRWERDLKPHGFHLNALVLDFPGGMPGDIGLFLVWGGAGAFG